MTGIFLNGEEMVWVTVDENRDGEWEVSFSNCKDHLLPLSQANYCVSTNTIPENYWSY